ncbi:glycosyltransferase family 2 protein [Wenyingzhuangia sp. IMCC45467]
MKTGGSKIAVLLTVFNRKEKTLACLKNVFAQELLDQYKLEVYLVNDGCTDGTPKAVAYNFPQVNIINANGNLFWNRGMHLGWSTAATKDDYDYYLWLNDDTMLNEGAINILLKTAIEKENKAIIIGTTAATANYKQVTYGGRSLKKGLLTPQKKAIPCDYFNGNIVLVPMEVYKIVGTHDPLFHHALGDFDYGLRAAKLGIQSFIAPGIIGKCDVHASLATWCNPKKTFKQRLKAFRSPLGNNPEEFFVFQKRHRGLLKAVVSYMSNHLRVVFPVLWIKK